MNLIPCELAVDEAHGGRRIMLPSGESLSISGVISHGGRGRVLMGIRPEHIHVLRNCGDPTSLSGRPTLAGVVDRLEYRGDAVLVTLDLAGDSVVARVSGTSSFGRGEAVVASFDPDRASWLSE